MAIRRGVAMKNPRTMYVCQSCGYQTPKWLGRCSDCGQWNSFVEERTGSSTRHGLVSAAGAVQTIAAISLDPQPRLRTGIVEFDRILGGGLVPGSLVLIGGDPGIGKSTLVLQIAERLCRSGLKALY